jgi:hypothetical protein
MPYRGLRRKTLGSSDLDLFHPMKFKSKNSIQKSDKHCHRVQRRNQCPGGGVGDLGQSLPSGPAKTKSFACQRRSGFYRIYH